MALERSVRAVFTSLVGRFALALLALALAFMLPGRMETGVVRLAGVCPGVEAPTRATPAVPGSHEHGAGTEHQVPHPDGDWCCGKLCSGSVAVPVVSSLPPFSNGVRLPIMVDDVRAGIEPSGLVRPPNRARIA
jgi:hypothetical protein